jgi:23S rRNA (uridine2552-2'-O)-methyltransferase
VDLGAAPGGWSQVLSQRSSADARILAVDVLSFDSVEKVEQIRGNFEDENVRRHIIDYLERGVNLVASDMAPSTIGHAQTDHARIMKLVESAYLFALDILEKEGSFVAKIFQGGREKNLFDSIKQNFRQVRFFKPKSSRTLSSEIYIVARGLNKCN